MDRDKQNAPEIAANVVAKIVLCASPFVKTLKVTEESYYLPKIVKLGAYWYEVEYFSRTKMLELLTKKSTEITEFHFVGSVDEKLLACLFRSNKIKKVKAKRSETFYREIPTESVEDLEVHFVYAEDVESFKGVCFLMFYIFYLFDLFFPFYRL